MGIRVAAASSSKNAGLFLEKIRLDLFAASSGWTTTSSTRMVLQQLFDADISGRDFPKGKPDPTIFLTAAQELGVAPRDCFVVEDATSRIQAAKAAGMAALGVARLDDRELLLEAAADLVVTSLDEDPCAPWPRAGSRSGEPSGHRRGSATPGRPPSVWTLAYDSFDPARQGLREALCALGNGYFVTRGALPEAEADGVNYPGTYVAGLYDRASTEIAGRVVENEDLVNVLNWLPMQFRVSDGVRGRLVRRPAGRRPRAPFRARHAPRHAHKAAALRTLGPADQHGPAPAGEHEGRAPGRPGDHVHGRELVERTLESAPVSMAAWSTPGSSATTT